MIIISRTNVLDKYKHQLKKHRLIVLLGFRIYIFYETQPLSPEN